jgi:hypothetical protein
MLEIGHAMTTAPPGLVPDSGAESEAVIREARKRQHRRYLLTGLAIVVLAGAAGVGVSQIAPGGQLPGHQGLRHQGAPRRESAPSSGRAGVPEFFADALTSGEGNGSLEVRSSANGALVAEQTARIVVGVTALAATGPGEFVIAEPAIAPGCGTRLYRVQLTGRGQLGRLAQVGPELPGGVLSLAASAGGQVIGYALSGCGKGHPGYVGVFNTRTGWSRTWGGVDFAGANVSGKPHSLSLGWSLSMSANGRLLAFTGWNVAENWRFTRQVVRVLPTDAPAGTLAERSQVVLSRPLFPPELGAVALSPRGKSFYLCTRSASRNGIVRKIAAYATATGSRRQVIGTLTGGFTETTCQMALDSTGRFLLLTDSANSPRPGTVVLRLAKIDLTTRAAAVLSIKLPQGSGMNPSTGMITAW